MTNQFFFICLLTGLLCAYCEYYWMKNGYRSLAIVASKCPKPSMGSSQIFRQIYQMFATTKDKQVGPIVCETFEIHTDPRSIFLLIKTLCLIGLTLKLVSSLKTVPNLLRTRQTAMKESNFISTNPSKGDGFIQQSKLFETSNGKIGVSSTTIEKRNLSIR